MTFQLGRLTGHFQASYESLKFFIKNHLFGQPIIERCGTTELLMLVCVNLPNDAWYILVSVFESMYACLVLKCTELLRKTKA